MSQGKDVVFVEMSIGSGPISRIHKHINCLTRNQYTISHLTEQKMSVDYLCVIYIGSDLS